MPRRWRGLWKRSGSQGYDSDALLCTPYICRVLYVSSSSPLRYYLFQSAGRRAHAATDAAESAEAGDVLKAYDPYNRGMYKGIKVSRESTETEVYCCGTLVPFLFMLKNLWVMSLDRVLGERKTCRFQETEGK